MRRPRCRTSRWWCAFCSATAPLTLSNTGRIASIACEIRCTASAEPAASCCSASIFLVISSVAPWVCTASALTSVATTAKPLAGFAGARGLDGGVEREQRGLPRDLGDQIDDIADRGGGFAQAVDIGAGFLRRGAGLIGELAGIAHLRADALRRVGEFFGGMGESSRRSLRGVGAPGQRVGALADVGKRRGGRLARRPRPNWRRARAGGSWRRARVPAVPGFPWPNRPRRPGAASAGGGVACGAAAGAASPAGASEINANAMGLLWNREMGGRYSRRPE